jgi:serine/threonine-protein kinase
VLSLADRLLDVLAAAHDKGIVHRDVKPENIFLTRDGQVKVLDFGIARMRELSAARLTLTTGGAIGTPAFMPPEQARGRWDDVGPRSDLWAVGATMFTLITGRLVHQAETLNELMLAAMTKPAPALAIVMPNVPPVVAALVDRALAYDIAARWPDARAMQAAVRAAYSGFDRASVPMPAPNAAIPAPAVSTPGGPTSQPVTLPRHAPVAARLPVLPVLAGLASAIVLGAGLLYVLARKPPPPAAASGAPTTEPAATAVQPAETAVPSATPSAAPSVSAAPAESKSGAPSKTKPGATHPRRH